MATGRIKLFKDEQGYGFIAAEDGTEYFLHISELPKGFQPQKGDLVEFETRQGRKGIEACRAVILENDLSTASTPVGRAKRPEVTPRDERPRARSNPSGLPQKQSDLHASPYFFMPRPNAERKLPRFHEKLNDDCFDIAFEVTWTALTPVAANPCSDPACGTTCPANDTGDYQGYDKRWLMVGNRLAISPFTVKSAIANGFAAILGSCYRVENSVVRHHPDPDKFQYTGAWRRYRVSRSNSFPGLLESINYDTGDVSVVPVTEYYYDQNAPPSGMTFVQRAKYYITFHEDKNRNIIDVIRDKPFPGATEVLYYDWYRFGMNLSFGPGDFRKNHYHRFYRIDSTTPLSGTVNPLNFRSCAEQEAKVYVGVFRKFGNTAAFDKRTGYDGNSWFQDLTAANPEFKRDKWVYYQLVIDTKGNKRISAIGLNYQFKTAFHLHVDAVPSSQQECRDMRQLCPRCALFGMSDDTKREKKEAIGYRGRFKAATLIGPEVKEGDPATERFPGKVPPTVPLKRWTSKGVEVAGQFLLEIQGQPKPNKRDIPGGYFDHETGMIPGAKEYFHADLTYAGLKQRIREVDICRTLDEYHGCPANGMPYTHTQRNYAMVCADGQTFSGVLGVENSSVDEIAALLLLLEHRLAGHGFKIGLGKSQGLGSMASTVCRVWIRRKKDFQEGQEQKKRWHEIDLRPSLATSNSTKEGGKEVLLLSELEKMIPGLKESAENLKTIQHALERLNLTENSKGRKLRFPPPGNRYWPTFKKNAAR
ncbi:MAG: hypothetical protein C4563_05315 [Desulfobulbus sp.]|jgi:cold shock CspA family protein|nr:MAG: hypothetical protein C4563_05315 [Desulfobulbus sp.]